MLNAYVLVLPIASVSIYMFTILVPAKVSAYIIRIYYIILYNNLLLLVRTYIRTREFEHTLSYY